MLPVHLHADEETARSKVWRTEQTEAWHILWAAEGVTILAGVRAEMTHQDLFRRLQGSGLRPRHAEAADPHR